MNKIILTILLLISLPAIARLKIVISEASDKPVALGVPDFVDSHGVAINEGLAHDFSNLLQLDLQMSGYFYLLKNSNLPQTDSDVYQIQLDKWRALEAIGLIKGVVLTNASKVALELRLYDVSDGSVLLGKRYDFDKKSLNDAVHKFADHVLESLTGARGPFYSKIAASCGGRFERKIKVFDVDGGRSSIASKSGLNAMSPAFSVDGQQLAYTAYPSKREPTEVYLNGKRLTKWFSTTLTPAFAPDGQSLIVSSSFKGDNELFLIGLNGQLQKRLTQSANIDFNPAVASDGRIAFASERGGGLQLFLTDMNGSPATQLTFTGYQNDQPDFSPDGQRLVFSGRDQGTYDIFIMMSDGTNIRRITSLEGSNESPTFSPDGRFIAFSSSRGGIFVMRADGTHQTLLPNSASCENLDWSGWLL